MFHPLTIIDEKIEHINGAIGTIIGCIYVFVNGWIRSIFSHDYMIELIQDVFKSVFIVIITSAVGYFFTKYLKKKF